MRNKLAIATAAILLLAASAPLWAHHAFSAEFDVTKPLTLKGTLTKWEMINPHSWFHIDVKGPDGKTSEWVIYTVSSDGKVFTSISWAPSNPELQDVQVFTRAN